MLLWKKIFIHGGFLLVFILPPVVVKSKIFQGLFSRRSDQLLRVKNTSYNITIWISEFFSTIMECIFSSDRNSIGERQFDLWGNQVSFLGIKRKGLFLASGWHPRFKFWWKAFHKAGLRLHIQFTNERATYTFWRAWKGSHFSLVGWPRLFHCYAKAFSKLPYQCKYDPKDWARGGVFRFWSENAN